MKNLEIKVSKPLMIMIGILKLIFKGMLEFVKFIATAISILVLLAATFLFGVNGMMMLEVDNWYDNASEHFYYQFTGDNLFLIHSLGVISGLIALAIIVFLLYLYIKNVTED